MKIHALQRGGKIKANLVMEVKTRENERGGGDIREHILKGDCFVKLSKLIFLKKVGAIYVLKLHILPLGIGSKDFNTIRSNTNSTVH